MDEGDAAGPRLPITLFADFACPYSYLTEVALAEVAEPGAVVSARAFELCPEGDLPRPDFDGKEWEALEELAGNLGVVIGRPEFRPRTRKAHEAARYARLQGEDERLRRALYAAYWEAARDIGRIDVLADIANALGLPGEDLKIALDIDRFRDDVLHDEEVARRLGIHSTPTTFIGSGPPATVVVGAARVPELRRLIQNQLRLRAQEGGNG